MRFLVTGASGFVGRNMLLKAPTDWRVVALYNTDRQFPAFVEALRRPNIVPVRCDLASADDVAALITRHGAQWDSCLHLAGKVDIPWSVREPRHDLLANTMPLLNLLDAVRVEKFIYFSSGAVYDGLAGEVRPGVPVAPTLPYAISKLACEHYVRFYQHRRRSIAKYLIVRFFGAYGPYEAPHKIYTRLIRTFAIEGQHSYTIYGDGANLIDAMYVDDTVDAVTRMLAGEHWNDTVNLAGGNPVAVEDLVRAVGAVLGLPAVAIEKHGIANEKNNFWGSAGEMQEYFGFRPVIALPEGVRRFSEFLLASHGA
jgi:nucleoside-diphosphate-sugar epimerase